MPYSFIMPLHVGNGTLKTYRGDGISDWQLTFKCFRKNKVFYAILAIFVEFMVVYIKKIMSHLK